MQFISLSAKLQTLDPTRGSFRLSVIPKPLTSSSVLKGQVQANITSSYPLYVAQLFTGIFHALSAAVGLKVALGCSMSGVSREGLDAGEE